MLKASAMWFDVTSGVVDVEGGEWAKLEAAVACWWEGGGWGVREGVSGRAAAKERVSCLKWLDSTRINSPRNDRLAILIESPKVIRRLITLASCQDQLLLLLRRCRRLRYDQSTGITDTALLFAFDLAPMIVCMRCRRRRNEEVGRSQVAGAIC